MDRNALAVTVGAVATKKRAYHHGDLRRALLEASIQLILERGLDALSLREVARRAGVSPAAPYHHFATRQELLAALAIDGFALLARAMAGARDAAAGRSAVQRFCATGEAYVRFALAHPAHFRLMFRPSLSGQLPLDGPPKQAFDILLGGAAELLEDPALRAHIDRRGLVLLAWSQVHGAAELLLDGPLAHDAHGLDAPPEVVPALVTGAFGGMLAALRSGGATPPLAASPAGRRQAPAPRRRSDG